MTEDAWNYQTVLQLEEKTVRIEMRCPDHYQAMMIYDELCAKLKTGSAYIHLVTKPQPINS